jgi:hypothetical protein
VNTKKLFFSLNLMSLVVQGAQQPSTLNLTLEQYVQRYQMPTGSQRIKPSNDPAMKSRMPLGWRLAAQRNNVSFSLLSHEKVNHPSGAAVFPENGGLAGSFNSLLTSLEKTPRASGYLRKVQFMALHDLFSHLVSVRSLFNLTHADSAHDYIASETTYALNKKAFIVGLLLNILQSQLHQIILNYFPTLPSHLAGSAGNLIMTHDYGADINFLIETQESLFFDPTTPTSQTAAAKNSILATQAQYLQVLNRYLLFFTSYTSTLNQQDTAPDTTPSNLFYRYASHIAQLFEQNATALQGQQIAALPANNANAAKNKVKALRAHTCLHPGLFFYTPESLRAIKIVPLIAQEIPQGTKTLDWPAQLVKAARSGQRAQMKDGTPLNYALAYFKNAQGTRITSDAGARGLFINIPTKNDLYEQEILRQPAWLNSKEGIITIMKACLGDIGSVIGMNILDPCIETILVRAKTLSPSTTLPPQCAQHLALIQQARKEYVQNKKTTSVVQQGTESQTTKEIEDASTVVSS